MRKYLLVFFLIPFYSYSGCEDGDCNNGYGTYIWFNGDTDTRGWVEGDKYVGMFLDGKMHGQGILYFREPQEIDPYRCRVWGLGETGIGTSFS